MERKFKKVLGDYEDYEIEIYRITPEEFAILNEHRLTRIFNFVPYPASPGSEIEFYETSIGVTGPRSHSVPDLATVAEKMKIEINTVRDFTIG